MILYRAGMRGCIIRGSRVSGGDPTMGSFSAPKIAWFPRERG